MQRSIFTRLLLIFALLFAQLGGLTHGISHALADPVQRSDQSLPHDKHCDLCVAYSHIGSTIGSNSFSFTRSDACEPFHHNISCPCVSHTFVAFAARAPPYSA